MTEPMTVEETAADYLHARVAAREFTPTTARTARYVLRDFQQVCPVDMTKIRPRHILRWMEAQAACLASTIASRYGIVRSFLRWASATGRIIRDPSHGIKGPARPRRIPRAVEPDDIMLLLDTAPDSRLRLAISLMAGEGLRLNEVCTLQIGDIDWHRGEVTVIGKGDKQRTVHLCPATASAARAYLTEHPASAGRLLRSQHDHHSPIGPARLGRLVSDHMAAQGVKHFPRDGKSPHAFRHSYCSDLVDAGLTLPEVADLAGHQSIETTMQYQRHVNLARTRDVANSRPYAASR